MSVTISNPPYNLKWKHPFFASSQPRFEFGVPPESNANFSFILTALENTERAVFLLPNSVLSTGNKCELKIKENLVNSNYIEAVIALPGNMFESTAIPTCLIVLNKKKEHYKVVMINLQEKATKQKRKQRGQSGKTNVKRVYEKEFNILSNDVVDEVLEVIENKTDKLGMAKTVSISDIKCKDYNLSPLRYIDLDMGDGASRSYKNIVGDMNRVIAKKNAVKITINENMAKSLGLYELAVDFNNGDRMNQTVNQALKCVGLKIEKEDVMTLSRSKEMKIDVKDFSDLPEIISLFLNMWRQRMMMLNNEEIILLTELRDALLPDLMTGKLSLDENAEEQNEK